MNSQLSDNLLISLREYLRCNLGLNYSENQDKELYRKIGSAASAFGFVSSVTFVEWLLQTALSNHQTGILASHLTVGETYFFREKKSFDFLEQIYLPGLILKRYGAERRLRVWCAGCATGEEAYSLAIALFQSIPDISHWNISILATDINGAFLEKAKLGIFSKWSFRTNSNLFISKYFTKVSANEFHILPEIKNMVTFSSINLAEDCYPSVTTNTQSIDIVFCRNVLIYFSPEGNRMVTDRFYNTLVNGGILVVSPVEMTGLICEKFSRIRYSGFTIYLKNNHRNEVKSNVRAKVSAEIVKPAPSHELKNSLPVSVADQNELIHLDRLLQERKHQVSPASEVENIENECIKAEILLEQGRFAEAEALLSNPAVKETLNDESVLFMLAKAKANLGKLEEAEALCRNVLILDKLNPKPYYLFATIMQEQGNDEKAISSLKQALYLDPDFVLANFLLGTLSFKSGNLSAGNKSFKNALSSLKKCSPADILPESDGLTAGRFLEIVNSITS